MEPAGIVTDVEGRVKGASVENATVGDAITVDADWTAAYAVDRCRDRLVREEGGHFQAAEISRVNSEIGFTSE